MPDRIEALVAQILTVRELVLNKGSADGIEPGMRFAILNKRGMDIRDPETGEVIDSIELPKTIVKIVRVQDRISVGRTFRITRVAGGPMYNPLVNLEQLTKPPRTVVETLKTDERRLRDEIDEKESYVKIGDPAVQVIGDEFDDEA